MLKDHRVLVTVMGVLLNARLYKNEIDAKSS